MPDSDPPIPASLAEPPALSSRRASRRKIHAIIARLSRRHRVRDLAESLFTPSFKPTEQVEPLVKALRYSTGFFWDKRTMESWAVQLKDLTDSEKQAVSETLTLIVENRLKSVPLMRFLDFLFLSVMIFGIVSALHLGGKNSLHSSLVTGAMFLFGALITRALLGFYFGDTMTNHVRATALIGLKRLRLPETCSVIAGTYVAASRLSQSFGGGQVRRAAAEALPVVLETLTPEHAGQLSAQTVPNLARALGHADAPLGLAILRALEQIGDGRAIPAVKQVAERGKTPALREEAMRLLPVLHARQRQESDVRRLLRPTEAPAAPPETLLRPARATPREDAQTLLRATDAGPDACEN